MGRMVVLINEIFVCLFGWFLNVVVSNHAISRTGLETDVWQFYVLAHMAGRPTLHVILTPRRSEDRPCRPKCETLHKLSIDPTYFISRYI